MKKLLVLLALCMVLTVALVACEKDPGTTDESTAGTTEAPTTEAPTTEAPTTEAPTTEEPTTEAPTTEAPTTEEPSTEPPAPPADPVKVSQSLDEIDTWISGTKAAAFFTPGQSASWTDKAATIEDYNVDTIRVWGWAGFFAETPGTFGYQIDDNDPVFDAAFSVEAGADVVAAAGGKSASRFQIYVPVLYLNGEHTIKALVKDAVGTVEEIVVFTITKAENPNAPVAFVAGASMYPDITGGSGFNKDNFVVSADGTYLTVDTIGQGDPYYTIKGLTGVATHVAIKYRTESTHTGAEMFVGSGAGRTGQGDHIGYSLVCDGNWQLAVVDVSSLAAITDNVINYVSWDPFAGPADATMDVAYAALFTSAEAAYAYDAQFADIYRNVPVHDDLPVTLGTRDGDTPFSPATDKKVGQKLPLGETILKQITIKALACYSDGNANTWSFKIWQWAGDYESTVAGTPLFVTTGENHGDCQDFVANIPAKLYITGDVYYEVEYLTGTGGFTGWTAKDIFEGVETYSGGAKRDGGYAAEVVVGVPYVQPENGDAEHPLTVGQTLAATSGLEKGQATDVLYYTTGVVTEIGEGGSYYKNVYFTDGENTMLIYTLNPMTDMPELKVGDTITVCGYVKNYEGTIEFASKEMEDGSKVHVYVIAHTPKPLNVLELNLADVEGSEDFAAAGYTGKVITLMNYGKAVKLGTADMGLFSQVIITYGCDGGAMLGDVGSELVLTTNGPVADGENNPIETAEVLGRVTLTNPTSGWASGDREAVIELDTTYEGDVYLCHNMKDGNGLAVSKIVLVFKDQG